jgi:uncharacterized protein (DUF1501 family)
VERRHFLNLLALTPLFGLANRPAHALAGRARYDRLLVLVELKGGNDGLNTVVPYAQPAYYALRPKLGIAREQVLQLDERVGLHPSLEPLLPLWHEQELAVVQGVGYPEPNLSHFRSIEIWDTASKSTEYLQDGWLTRAFAGHPTPPSFAADGVIVGSPDLGPLAGGGTRAIALSSTEQFLRQARYAADEGRGRNKALEHILKVEADIVQAAAGLHADYAFRTGFPPGEFGNAILTASQVIANRPGVAVVRITLGGFDTHNNQPGVHARLLKEFATGMAALKSALEELDRWNDTLILTYAEFGRRPRENQSNGTDHGTASVHFALGGRVRGGLYGACPALDRLNGDGNPDYAVDFRSLYATALESWWGVPSADVLGARHATLPLLRGA